MRARPLQRGYPLGLAMLLSLSNALGNVIDKPQIFQTQGADSLTNQILCKLPGHQSNCNQLQTPTPFPSSTSPDTSSPDASPPSGPAQAPVPVSPQNEPTLVPVVPLSPSAPSPGPAPSLMDPAPTPLQLPPTSAPLQPASEPAPEQLAPAPVPSLEAPAPAPQAASDPALLTFVIAASGLAGSGSSRFPGASTSVYDTLSGLWQTGPLMTAPQGRYSFAMVQLSPTEVIAAGGDGTGGKSAEIYSTVTQRWQATSSMQQYRIQNQMVALPNGAALTVGGLDADSRPLLPSEIYFQGAWRYGPNLQTGRSSFTIDLYDAVAPRVLVCGGRSAVGDAIATCEEISVDLEPDTNFALQTSSLVVGVYDHRMVVLNDLPFITGGTDSSGTIVGEVQLYEDGQWQSTVPMKDARARHEMVVHQNGQVLVCGGFGTEGPLTSCEIYDGSGWSMGPTLPFAQTNFRMLVLPNGDVLYYGTATSGQPVSGIWTPGTPGTPVWMSVPGSFSQPARAFFGMSAI